MASNIDLCPQVISFSKNQKNVHIRTRHRCLHINKPFHISHHTSHMKLKSKISHDLPYGRAAKHTMSVQAHHQVRKRGLCQVHNASSCKKLVPIKPTFPTQTSSLKERHPHENHQALPSPLRKSTCCLINRATPSQTIRTHNKNNNNIVDTRILSAPHRTKPKSFDGHEFQSYPSHLRTKSLKI